MVRQPRITFSAWDIRSSEVDAVRQLKHGRLRLEQASIQVLWEDGERAFCRRVTHAGANPATVLTVVPVAEPPSPAILEGFAHELTLKDELEGEWAVRPLELERERGRTMLVLEDPGGAPL